MNTAAELFARHRPLVALFIVAMTLAAGWGISRLEFDDVPRAVFKAADQDYANLEQFFRDFESDDSDCLIVVESENLFAPGASHALRRLITEVEHIPGVKSVRSLADVVVFDEGQARSLLPNTDDVSQLAEARRRALVHPMIRGQVLSADGNTALVIARLESGLSGISQIKPVIQQLNQIAQDCAQGSSITVRLTGVPCIRVEIYSMVQRETQRFVVIGVVLAFSMAIFLFRQFWASIVVAIGPILASIWTMGALGLVGERLNVINTMLPTLILVVGFADSMHLMTDIRHSLNEGCSPLEAAKSSIRHLLMACFLTAGTTAIGFGALSMAEIDIIRRFGLAAAAGSVLSFLAVMTVVPLLASTRLSEGIRAAHSQDFIVRHFPWFVRRLDWILDRARTVVIIGGMITLLLSTSMLRLVPDNRLVEMIPRDNDSFRALRHLDRVLGGSLSVFVVVDWGASHRLQDPEVLAAIERVQRLLISKPQLHAPLSVLDLLKSLPASDDNLAQRVPMLGLVPPDVLSRYARPDLHRAVVVARLQDIGSAASRPLYDELDRDLAALQRSDPDIRLYLTGTSVVGARTVHKMIQSLNQSLLGAAGAIFIAIGIGFRSLRLALISILPNLFPMVATASLLVWTGLPLQMTSVMVFSICLGIAVDDTIHFLNRFQRELAVDGDVRASIRRAFYAVGSAVITTTLVLITGFGSVLTSEMPSSRLFGWLACAAFTTAIFGDLILLPPLLLCFYRGKHSKLPAGSTLDQLSAPASSAHIALPTASSVAPAAASDSADRADETENALR